MVQLAVPQAKGPARDKPAAIKLRGVPRVTPNTLFVLAPPAQDRGVGQTRAAPPAWLFTSPPPLPDR